MNRENLDEIIKQYAQALEIMGNTYGGEVEKTSEKSLASPVEEILQEVSNESQNEENIAQELNADEESAFQGQNENESEFVNTEPAVKESASALQESKPSSTASFSAAVFYGEGALPVKGARVVVYKGDDIYAFLETDENGSTKRITLPAFDKENSLEADNPNQSIDYFADVFAEGFISQKGLLVSSVGESDIFLRVLLIPESERIG